MHNEFQIGEKLGPLEREITPGMNRGRSEATNSDYSSYASSNGQYYVDPTLSATSMVFLLRSKYDRIVKGQK